MQPKMPRKRMTKKTFVPLLLNAGLFCFTLFLFAPVNLFFSNQGDFQFSLMDMLPYVALYGVLLTALLTGIGALVRKKVRAVYTAFLMALSILMYAQANFLNVNYGVLDGRGVRWESFQGVAILNTAIWLIIIGLCIFFAIKKTPLFRRVASYVAGALLLVQAGTLGVLMFTTPLTYERPEWVVTQRNATTLSTDKNTVIFLVDACDTTYFEEIMHTAPETLAAFDGFTYFPDFVGSYSKTKMSLPFILSGKWYENKEPISDFLHSAYADVPLIDTLISNNYDLGLYTPSIYMDQSLIGRVSNLSQTPQTVNNHFALAAQMMRFSSFSLAPHVLKPALEFYSGAFNAFLAAENGEPVYINDNYLFADIANTPFTLTDSCNALRFYHTTGSHLPCNMDANGNYVGEWQSTAVEQTKGVLLFVTRYIEQMKQLNIYDDATIIVMADHGRFDDGVTFPLFFIKPPHATGSIKISPASVSQAQLHATILACAGLENTGEEVSVFDMDENADNARRFLYYPTTYQNGGYLPDLEEYVITRGLKYAPTGNVYAR